MNNCCNRDEQILHIARCQYRYFFNKANVIGIGLGYKVKEKVYTSNKCIVVFVTKKLPSNEIPPQDLIPPYYNGILTDVVQSNFMTTSSLINKIRPVQGGYCIGLPNYSSGTMGCLVKDRKSQYILSSNHVIAQNGKEKLGTPIIQPGEDFGGKVKTDKIGVLSKFIKVGMGNNYVDCAIAKMDDDMVSNNITMVGPIKGVSSPKVGERVQKIGSTTELTWGRIKAIGVTEALEFMGDIFVFFNQIITTKMGAEGDSGSVLLDKDMKAIGLLMGGEDSYNIFNSITDVLNNLDVQIVTG
ncbi:hypothetical protein IRP63_04680 [Clostridium botulinum]|uniref:Peptidase S1 domain-containing protein n=1 Tax=Clostridium botulinum C/D str. DC5 TaxID=1443128 RepID=A0A0A0IKU5_CLOBO|nr:hypothetical protein [Clostridium botulinum]KEI00773.1 hypothetical protein Z952_00255 [Clostridium botulinum C/D str. BKT75002]KEI11711.1 hypothetical protein Z954_07240 [Clostridium botulinum C/D str. BKT2873]KGM95025.1 hypothetical protein Z956_05930 [Clostridium botulinum D str. CCUG 7971]KGN00196.1 hypothetical protein Z955_04160 [Clostridium botulinum C/D str. DC5]KOC50839.1 hypothetical protein ADU88_01220 [Clostridium botulinum]